MNHFIVYGNSKLLIKGGFFDASLEINSIASELKEKLIALSIFNSYKEGITLMEMTKDEKMFIIWNNKSLINFF